MVSRHVHFPGLRIASLVLLAAICLPMLIFPAAVQADWSPAIRLSTGGGYAVGAAVAVSGNYVHACWMDEKTGNDEIYYRRSADGGASWGPEARLTNDPADSYGPAIAASGSYVHVVWYDVRDGTDEIYYKRSTDNGVTWGPDTRLSALPDRSFNVDMTASGSYVHVVWQDQRDGNREIYYKRSTDNGATWEADFRMTYAAGAGQEPAVAASGNYVYVAWEDTRTGDYNIFFKASANNGATWTVDRQMTSDPNTSWYVSIAISGDIIHLAWDDNRDGDREVYYTRSEDGGATWEPDIRLTTDPEEQHQVNVSASGGNVLISWLDARTGPFEQVYYRQSPTGGLSWGPETCLTSGTGDCNYPRACLSGSTVHIVWSEQNLGPAEVFYKRSPAFPAGVRAGQVNTDLGQVNFSIDNGSFTSLAAVPRTSTPCIPGGYYYPFGMFSFNIGNLTPGQAARVTIRFPSALGGGFKYFKCRGQASIDCTSLVTRLDDYTIVLTLTDGGIGDLDGVANGVIVDPGGPALRLNTPQSSHQSSLPATPQAPVSLSNITVKSASLSAGKVTPGTPVTITASLSNTGTGNGTSVVKVYVNGAEEAQQGITVNSGGTSTVTFDVSRNEPGTYTVHVGSTSAGSFTVDQFTPDTILYISGALILFALVGGVIYLTRRRA